MDMEIAAWLASTLVFTTFFMKTMASLRIVAIASNVAFIAYALLGLRYGIFGKILPIFVLHVLLLPLNVIRLAACARTRPPQRARAARRTACRHGAYRYAQRERPAESSPAGRSRC